MFKKFKSLFVVEVPDPKDQGKLKKVPAPKSKAVNPTPKPTKPGEVSDQFLEVLFKAMEHNNLEGFDYLEYKQSLQSLAKMDMDEATRYKSAYAMAQTMGADAQHLMKTAQHYIDVLKSEANKFERALQKQQTDRIGTKQTEIKQLDGAIAEKTKHIQQLQKEINEHQKQRETLQKLIGEASIKIQATHANFEASFQLLVQQIMKDLENIKVHLEGK